MDIPPKIVKMGAVQSVAIQDQLGMENLCFGCGPDNPDGLRIKSYWEGDETVCRYQPGPEFTAGPRHVLNGGIIATVIDCHSICTAVAWAYKNENRAIGSDPRIWCVTGSLEIQYLRPTPIAEPVELRARVESSEGKKTTVTCVLSSGGIERARARTLAVRVPLSWRGS